MSTARVDNFGPSAGGTTRSLRGIAAAWANLNGIGTIELRDSQNVSSVVDSGVGVYDFNFTNTFANTNYQTQCAGDVNEVLFASFFRSGLYSAATMRYRSYDFATNVADTVQATINCHGDLA